MNRSITLRCPAKVNLALSVGRPTPDGYHPIASWMTAIDLCDELTLEPADGESQYDIAWADDAPQPSAIDWPIASDLIVKAHRLVEERIGRLLPVRAKLRKRIPVGAGLAGGSTDGAAMFKGLRQLFALEIDDPTLIELAMKIGSDLAFFFSSGSAIVTGRGEALREAPMDQPLHLCLILPDFGCPTGAVYRAFDELSPHAIVDEKAVELCVLARPLKPFNDLAAPACRVQPPLADLKSEISDTTSRTVHITGSGAGMFIVGESADDANALARVVAERLDVVARSVVTTRCKAASGPNPHG